MISYILAVVTGLVVIAADQITKYLVASNMQLNEQRDFIDGFINFWYIHNKGGAWGFLSDRTWILISITIAAILVFLTLIVKYAGKSRFLFWSSVFIISGGIGNLIDRILHGEVVDFLNFQFFDFPVFNVADCAVVLGVIMLLIYFVWDIFKSRSEKLS